jgi:hypothetical protein
MTKEQESKPENTARGMADHNPNEWVETYRLWRSAQTVHRPGYDDAGAVKFLHLDFCEWCAACDEVPCNYAAFEELLRLDGWTIQNGFALGLFLKADAWGLEGKYSTGKEGSSNAR